MWVLTDAADVELDRLIMFGHKQTRPSYLYLLVVFFFTFATVIIIVVVVVVLIAILSLSCMKRKIVSRQYNYKGANHGH